MTAFRARHVGSVAAALALTVAASAAATADRRTPPATPEPPRTCAR